MPRPRSTTSEATPDQMTTIITRLGWAKRHNAAFNGVPYHDELFDGGAHLTLYVPKDLPVERLYGDEVAGKAIKDARAARDLISLEIMSVPNEWLENSGWLNGAVADQIVDLANLQGLPEAALDVAYKAQLESKYGDFEPPARSPSEKVEAMLSCGATPDQIAQLIWGEGRTWADVKASYSRGRAETEAIWMAAGYEVANSGGDCYAAYKEAEGIQFMVTDYAESSELNPEFRLSLGAYSALTGEHLNYIGEFKNLGAIEAALPNKIAELQSVLASVNESAGMQRQRKSPGPRL